MKLYRIRFTFLGGHSNRERNYINGQFDVISTFINNKQPKIMNRFSKINLDLLSKEIN